MALNRKDTPVGLDLEIDKIQVLIYNYLTANSCVKGDYSSYESYNRVYKNETEDGVVAETFLTGNDYKDVFMNDNVAVSSFIIANDDIEDITATRKQRTVSVIFQIDLKKVYGQLPHRADSEFHNEISNALKGLKKPSVKTGAKVGISNVYSEFEVQKLKDKFHDMQPLHVFRQDIDVQYDYDCCPTFANSGCTVRVSVETTNETSLGANDGTAEALVTLDQGNITYLWNDPLEQTTAKITGLTPNTYTVTVTDDNVVTPVCAVIGSGTVAAGVPIPDCDMIISGVVTVGTTGSSGTATATVIDNNGGVNYVWEQLGGYLSTSNPATGLAAGQVTLSVSDSGVGPTCMRNFCTDVPVSNGNAVSFKGDGDHITFTPVNFTAGSDSTVQFQFYADSVSSQQVLLQGDNLISPEVITILNSGAFLIRLNTTSKVFDVPTMSANTWNTFHQTIVDGVLRVYINGVESDDSFDSVFEWDFRHINDGQGIGLEFKGLMDNICMDNTHGASIAEIVEMVANPSEFKNIIGSANRVYNCNQTGATTTLNDTSGNNEDGTMDGLIAEPFVPHV